jgi:uncharacterized protein (TIGR03067 family)
MFDTGFLAQNEPCLRKEGQTMLATELKTIMVLLAASLASVSLAPQIGSANPQRIERFMCQEQQMWNISELQVLDATKKVPQELQGSWALVETQRYGAKVAVTKTGVKLHKLSFDGKKVFFHAMDRRVESGSVEVDSAKEPQMISFNWRVPWHAIFRVEGDTLTVCFNQANAIRPDSFRTSADNLGRVLFRYYRSKPVSDLEPFWETLGAMEEDSYPALWAMIDNPKASLGFLSKRIAPEKQSDPKLIRTHIANLDSGRFPARDAATKALMELGDQAAALMNEALKGSPSAEMRVRLNIVLETLSREPGPEERRRMRAIKVVEIIGTTDAREVLQSWASGAPDSRYTKAAMDALERLKERKG